MPESLVPVGLPVPGKGPTVLVVGEYAYSPKIYGKNYSTGPNPEIPHSAAMAGNELMV